MNFLLDFLPLLLFFLSFKWAEHHADAVAQTLTAAAAWLGLDWQVPVSQAPAMLGTLVVIVSTALQITFMRARRMPIPPMLLVSGGLVAVFGGLTLWLRNEAFIQWKPTLLYGAFALAFAGMRLIKGVRLIQKTLPKEWVLPDAVFERLNWAWTAFFLLMALINAVSVVLLDFSTWLTVKFWTVTVLPIVFVVAQTMLLSRHLPDDSAEPGAAGTRASTGPTQENPHG